MIYGSLSFNEIQKYENAQSGRNIWMVNNGWIVIFSAVQSYQTTAKNI